MTRSSLNRIKKVLQEHLKDITDSIAPLKEAFAIGSDDRMDDLDYASAKAQQHLAMRLHERRNKFSDKLASVTQSIEDGTFGICRECGDEIDPARLEARPMTVFCVRCKDVLEREERRRRTAQTQRVGRLHLLARFA